LKRALINIALLIIVIAMAFGAHLYDKRAAVKASYAQGKNDALIDYLQTDIKTLTTVITQTQALIDHANAISATLDAAIAKRQVTDQKTTQEIYRALSRTANERIDCDFDDSVMQQLAAARDRANQAAATGIGNPVPAGTGTR
jgi:hypothetical protein